MTKSYTFPSLVKNKSSMRLTKKQHTHIAPTLALGNKSASNRSITSSNYKNILGIFPMLSIRGQISNASKKKIMKIDLCNNNNNIRSCNKALPVTHQLLNLFLSRSTHSLLKKWDQTSQASEALKPKHHTKWHTPMRLMQQQTLYMHQQQHTTYIIHLDI